MALITRLTITNRFLVAKPVGKEGNKALLL